ncbi:Thioredoxin Domain-Containing Protein 2 [Manis pentadactyla]|nr:Thioredoxin Domain-Containing Protein 2 [Manis pentadactyla]
MPAPTSLCTAEGPPIPGGLAPYLERRVDIDKKLEMESDKAGAPGELEVGPYKQEETSRADANESPLLQVMSSHVTPGVPELLDPAHPQKKASAHEVNNIQHMPAEQHTPAAQSEVLQPKDITTPEQGSDISNSTAQTIPPKQGGIFNFSEKNILPKHDGTPDSSAKRILFKQADILNFPAKTILPKKSNILNFSEKAIPLKQRDIPKSPAKTMLPKQDTPAKNIPPKQGDSPSSSTKPVLPKLGNILKVSAKTILPKWSNIPKSSEETVQPKEGGTPKSSEEAIQPIEGNIPKLAEEAMELLDVDMIKVILSKEDFELALKEAGEKLVVVDVSATWCGPCGTIKPLFRSLSVKHEDVVFLEVDVDDCEELVKDLEIICIPTFQFYKKEEKVGEICGALKEKLEAIIAELK